MVAWGAGHNLEKNLGKVQGLRERGQLDRALKQLQDWARKYPDTPHYLYEAAMVAFELGDYGSGITALKTLLRTLPDTREKVLTACEERYAEKPALPLAEFLVESHLGDGRYAEALEVADALEPESVEMWSRKTTMRHQSLMVTPNTPPQTLRLSHGIQLVVAHARKDGVIFAEALESLIELDGALLESLEPIAVREAEGHPEPAQVFVAQGLCRAAAGRADEASVLWSKAAQKDRKLVSALGARLESLDPDPDQRGAWWRSRGTLARLAGDGKAAAEAFMEAADAAPALRDELLAELQVAEDSTLEGRDELLKLRLRLLVVQKRHAEVPPLAKRLREEGLATAQELRALMGENSGGEVASDMLAALAETALHDGDLGAAATHANEIPVQDEAALGRVLRTIEELGQVWEGERHLQLMALRAMLQARSRNRAGANETLVGLWETHADDPETLFQITERCLDQVEPTPELWLAHLPSALRADRVGPARAMLGRVLGESPAPSDEPAEVRPLFGGTDELMLDFDGEGEAGLSDEIAGALVDLLEPAPDLAEPFLELVDGCDRSLGLPQRLRYAIALASLQCGRFQRALPEFSVLLMMADDELGDRVLGHLEQTLGEHPDQPDLHVAIADLLVDREEIDAAARHLGEALRADPSRAEELSGRFEALLARAGHEADARLWTSYADALFHAGRFDQLSEVCRKASEQLPVTAAAPIHVLQCRMLAEEGRLSDVLQAVQRHLHAERIPADDAVTILQDVLAANPASSIGQLLLGQACTRADRIDEAIAAYLEAVRIDPKLQRGVGEQLELLAARPGTQGSHLLRIARFHLGRGENTKAAQVLESALRMDASLADRLLGELHDVIESAQGDLDLLGVGAVAARHAGQVEVGCELLVRTEQRDPSRTEWVLTELLRLAEAFPDRLLPVLCRARVLLQRGSAAAAVTAVVDSGAVGAYALDERVEMLHEFHRRLPKDARLPLALAAVLGEKGAIDAAIEMVREAQKQTEFDAENAVAVTTALVTMAPAHPELRLLHHDLLLRVGHVDEALRALPEPEVLSEWQQPEISERMAEHLERVHANAGLASIYARSLRRQGRTEDAIEALRQATARTGVPATDPLWSELARMLHEAGQAAESVEILHRQAATVEDRRRAYQLFDEWNRQRVESEVAALEERRRQRPQAAHVALQLAEKLLEQGNPERLPEVLSGDTPDAEWRTRRACLLGRAYLEMDRADMAEAVLLAVEKSGDSGGEFAAELRWWLAECAERLGRPAESHARYLSLLDDPVYAPRVEARARQTYGHYLEDVAGEYRAILTRVSTL